MRRRLGIPLLLAVASLFAIVPASQAAAPKFLKRMGAHGDGAGEMRIPAAVGTDPSTGHLYVVDRSRTNRISEYTPWGDFVKAFGWDVAPGAVDEEQEVRIRATAGQFRLTFEGSTTGDLPFDASSEEVESALNALPSISSGVSVAGGPGGIPGTTPSVYVVRFEGPLEGSDVDQLTAIDGSTPLSGGGPTGTEVGTRADGTSGGTSLEACTSASGCQAGTEGPDPGQFSGASSIAIDDAGDIYVQENHNRRLQKFDSAGRFLWMVGGEVNKTTGADICTKADLEILELCGEGVEGIGPREFSGAGALALGANQHPYVADKGRIQEFEDDGSFAGEITPELDPLPPSQSEAPGNIAIDPLSGDFYWSFQQGIFENERTPGVFRLSPNGELIATLPAERPGGLATNSVGDVYVIENPKRPSDGNPEGERVVAFNAAGGVLITAQDEFAKPVGSGELTDVGTNTVGDVFVGNRYIDPNLAYVDAFGPGPVALEPPPKVPPSIGDQWANSVNTDGATVRASIDPRFWADTRYFVEYGTGDCEAGGCATVPAPPGSLLTDEVVSGDLKTASVFLGGLEPGTTYHYRFVAESSGGGPVVGPDATFTTAKAPTGHAGECSANEALRSGPSANLPDCRAYEMVSPVDKNGGDLSPICENLCYQANLDQSAEAGSALTYSSYKSFGDSESAPYISQYLAKRAAEGWLSDGITPALGDPILGAAEDLDTPFKAFTPDLATAWFTQIRKPDLDPSGAAPNIYRRDNASGTYQALSPEAMDARPELQAITPDGRCAVFRVKDALTEEAKPDLTQIYRSCDGQIDLVSILPSGVPSAKESSAGAAEVGTGTGREQNVFNAISADGNRVFWSESRNGSDPLYLRLVESGETLSISSGAARFRGASTDGSRVIYDGAGKLVEAQVEEGVVTRTTIANEVLGVPGMSEDVERVYFVSEADLDGAGPAAAGQPNLYLHEVEGEKATNNFVATLVEADMEGGQLRPVANFPVLRTARTNPSGSHLVFMSRGRLTGFDNTDQNSGEADAEVFLYDSEAEEGAGRLICASCNPTGARPVGRELVVALKGSQPSHVWAAARIPTYVSQLYGSRVISDDGSRLYFESFEPLTPLDTNGQGDVYQWEQEGTGSCSAEDSSYNEASGGCVELISSGKSPSDSSFVDASADGTDVFIRTASSLLPQDPALVDIYDAREGGGFPPPAAPPAACEGEACQGPLAAPNDPTPASQAFDGPGNVKPQGKKPRCPKGKVRRKGRCVKKGKSKHEGNREKSGKSRRSRGR